MKCKILLASGTLEGNGVAVRLHTKFRNIGNSHNLKEDQEIAQIHLLTNTQSYKGALLKSSISPKLTLNTDLLNRLENVLSNKNSLILTLTQINESKSMLIISTELQTHIVSKMLKIQLCQLQMRKLHQHPLKQIKILLQAFSHQHQSMFSQVRKQQQKLQIFFQRIQEQERVMQQNSNNDISLIKQTFIPILNQTKKRYITCLHLSNEENERRQKQKLMKQRQFYKIKGVKNNPKEQTGQRQESKDQTQLLDIFS